MTDSALRLAVLVCDVRKVASYEPDTSSSCYLSGSLPGQKDMVSEAGGGVASALPWEPTVRAPGPAPGHSVTSESSWSCLGLGTVVKPGWILGHLGTFLNKLYGPEQRILRRDSNFTFKSTPFLIY